MKVQQQGRFCGFQSLSQWHNTYKQEREGSTVHEILQMSFKEDPRNIFELVLPLKFEEVSQNRRSVGRSVMLQWENVTAWVGCLLRASERASESVSPECRWMSEQTNEGRNEKREG